jgi:hypothetical protein
VSTPSADDLEQLRLRLQTRAREAEAARARLGLLEQAVDRVQRDSAARRLASRTS